MKRYEIEKLEVIVEDNVVNMHGMLTMQLSADISAFFETIINEIDHNSIIVHFNELKYMNSAALRFVLKFVKSLNEKKIKTKVIYNEKQNWQKLSFKAVEGYCHDMEYITISSG